jgi:hypothetical protein
MATATTVWRAGEVMRADRAPEAMASMEEMSRRTGDGDVMLGIAVRIRDGTQRPRAARGRRRRWHETGRVRRHRRRGGVRPR